MKFERILDSGYPHVWDTWESDGATWIVQDLPPEDDEEAVRYMAEEFMYDEPAIIFHKIIEDPVSVEDVKKNWAKILSQRLSIACYRVKDGQKTLTAFNLCLIKHRGESLESQFQIEGDALKRLLTMTGYLQSKFDTFEYFGEDRIMIGIGLLVRRAFRGAKLGARVLEARKPLALSLGVKATDTIFTNPGSQKLADICGYTTVVTETIKSLAEDSLGYSTDDERVFKLMVKKFE